MASKLWFIVAFLPVMTVLGGIQLSSKDEINFINSAQSSWKADYNSMSEYDTNKLKKKLGLKPITEKLLSKFENNLPTNVYHLIKPDPGAGDVAIPKNYDTRSAWPNCAVIRTIKDQSTCGSCWAVSVASMLSDRLCIATKGTIDINLSSEDLIRCCHRCKDKSGNGCTGGNIIQALLYLNYAGIVTGDDYGSNKGCMPYSTKPCQKSSKKITDYSCINSNSTKSGQCDENCTNEKYSIPFQQDKYYALYPYKFKNELDYDDAKKDIMQHGSSIAIMKVYKDLIYYQSGIYRKVTGKYIGAHAIRLIGWGIENGTEYWLAANSWGKLWGLNGTVKISIHKNGCNFGKLIFASKPWL